MKLLYKKSSFIESINNANKINETYNKSVNFHCYWNGSLNEKHLYSILSCYYFNVYNNKHKIILWLENNIPNEYNKEIEKYAEIRYFSLDNEKKNMFLENINIEYGKSLPYYSDAIRCILLYNYGGIWFDLDCLFLRCFDPLFYNFENDICCYEWENQNYPNNAILISLQKESHKMKNIIQFIIERKRGWGFQEANITYDLPIDILVLPCSWFDSDWIENSYNIGFENFFKNTNKKYNFDTFFKGAFCYHWHNKWNKNIEENSIFNQLINIIKSKFIMVK